MRGARKTVSVVSPSIFSALSVTPFSARCYSLSPFISVQCTVVTIVGVLLVMLSVIDV